MTDKICQGCFSSRWIGRGQPWKRRPSLSPPPPTTTTTTTSTTTTTLDQRNAFWWQGGIEETGGPMGARPTNGRGWGVVAGHLPSAIKPTTTTTKPTTTIVTTTTTTITTAPTTTTPTTTPTASKTLKIHFLPIKYSFFSYLLAFQQHSTHSLNSFTSK